MIPSKFSSSYTGISFGIACAFLLTLPALPAASFTWTGKVNASWGEERNWTPEGIPAEGDSVEIGTNVAVDLGGPREVATLTLRGGASLINGGEGGLTLGQGEKGGALGIVTLSGGETSIDVPVGFVEIGADPGALFFLEGNEGDVITVSQPVDFGLLDLQGVPLVLQEHENAAHVVFSGVISGNSGEHHLQILPGCGAVTLAGENDFQSETGSLVDFSAHLMGETSTLYLANNRALGDERNRLRVAQGYIDPDRQRVARVLISEPDIQIENEVIVGRGAITEIGGSNTSGVCIWKGAINLVRQPEATGAAELPVRFVAEEGGTVEFMGRIVDAAGGFSAPVEKTGPGTVVLSPPRGLSNHGPTTVKEGTLLVLNTAGPGTGLGPVFVEQGAVLGGTGHIAPTMGEALVLVREAGVLMAGDGEHADGFLSIESELVMEKGSVLRVLLGPPGANSALARGEGAFIWSFAEGQQVEVLLQEGASPGTYPAIITGLDSDPGVDSWTVSTPGFEKSRFAYDGNGNVDLLLAR